MAWSLWFATIAIVARVTGAWPFAVPHGAGAMGGPHHGLMAAPGAGRAAKCAATLAMSGSSTMFGMDNVITINEGVPAFLVGATIKQDKYNTRSDMWGVHESLDELGRLCETAGMVVVGREHQTMQHPSASTFIGTGKLEEVKQALERLEQTEVAIVVFDEELSPAQGRNLQESLGRQVLDRTQLILQIFKQRARSREAKLQVQVAQMRYMLPRLGTFMTQGAGMDSKGGGGGGGSNLKGMGEKQIEVDRRLFRKQIQRVEAQMEELRVRREGFREKRRKRDTLPVVAIVGYTNAGKSSLLNQLCIEEQTYADDLLFATLDTTTRRVVLPGGKEVLFSDTVGFIQKLPTKLVSAFLATLEELQDAAVVLHVVDAASPLAASQIHAVQEIIEEEGAGDTPQVLALNKADAVKTTDVVCEDGIPTVSAAARAAFGDEADDGAWSRVHPNVAPSHVVAVSAREGSGIGTLLATVETALLSINQKVEVLLPYSAGNILSEMHQTGVILEEEYEATGTRVVAYVPPSVYGKLGKFLSDGKKTEKEARYN